MHHQQKKNTKNFTLKKEIGQKDLQAHQEQPAKTKLNFNPVYD